MVDSGADLNAYAQVEGQGGCCSPAMSVGPSGCCGGEDDAEEKTTSRSLTLAGCCSAPAAEEKDDASVHGGLAELLKRYDVNEFAASVKVFAVKR